MEAQGILFHVRRAENAFTHRRFDHCRTYRIDPNAIARGFERGGLGEADHAMLAGAVCGRTRRTDPARDRRHVDDGPATALLEHLPNLVLQAKAHTVEIDVDGALPVFFRLVHDRYPSTLDAGIVKRD